MSTDEIEAWMAVSVLVIDNSHANSIVMSGGERIAIELSKQWTGTGKAEITVLGSNLTSALWSRYLDGSPVDFIRINQLREEENLFTSYMKRVVKGIAFAARFRIEPGETT